MSADTLSALEQNVLSLSGYDREITYTIPDVSPVSAGDHLRSLGYSHRLLARLKRTRNAICLNGEWIPSGMPVCAGDILTVRVPYDFHTYEYFDEDDTPDLARCTLPHILLKDADILVVSKPADMPTHPSHGHHGDTLSEICALMLLQDEPDARKAASLLAAEPGSDTAALREKLILPSLRCCSRLDRDTSGLLVMARHAFSSCILSDAMKRREIKRTYQAIVHGQVRSEGTLSAPIAREEGSSIKRCVDMEKGDSAVTHYRPLCYRPDLDQTLIRLQLETGRTHQIRVHMSHLGHPLVGDTLYGAPALNSSGLAAGQIRRGQLLHSCQLSFTHPLTGQPLTFTQPLPPDMQYIL